MSNPWVVKPQQQIFVKIILVEIVSRVFIFHACNFWQVLSWYELMTSLTEDYLGKNFQKFDDEFAICNPIALVFIFSGKTAFSMESSWNYTVKGIFIFFGTKSMFVFVNSWNSFPAFSVVNFNHDFSQIHGPSCTKYPWGFAKHGQTWHDPCHGDLWVIAWIMDFNPWGVNLVDRKNMNVLRDNQMPGSLEPPNFFNTLKTRLFIAINA